MSKADVIKEIADERRRQIEREGWTPEHDNEHGDGSLARAAACYAAGERLWCAAAAYRYNELWPWEDAAWKPKDRRRDLIRAAALIVAEVERLDRAAPASVAPGTAGREAMTARKTKGRTGRAGFDAAARIRGRGKEVGRG